MQDILTILRVVSFIIGCMLAGAVLFILGYIFVAKVLDPILSRIDNWR